MTDYNANIIIKNNSIDQGRYSDGINPSTYNYTSNISVFGSSLIEGNSFLNPASNADMLNITDGSCIVRNNKFVRNTTSINSYIRHFNSLGPGVYNGIHEITDNIFDFSTTNGSNEQLVTGLNPGTIYTRNKNQTGFIYLPIYDQERGWADTNDEGNIDFNEITYTPMTVSGGGITQQTAMIRFGQNLITEFIPDAADSANHSLLVTKSFNVSDYFENGMNIIGLRIGAYVFTGTFSGLNSFFSAIVVIHNGSKSMDPKNSSAILEENSTLFTCVYNVDSTAKQTAIAKATQIGTQTFGGSGGLDGNFFGFVRPDYFRIGNGYFVEVKFDANMAFTNAFDVGFSPIEVKYQW